MPTTLLIILLYVSLLKLFLEFTSNKQTNRISKNDQITATQPL